MKEYIITEDQKKSLEAKINEMPLKYAAILVGALVMLNSLPEIQEEKQPIEEPK